MSQYRQFIFDSYGFDPKTGVLQLHYAIDNAFHFTETYKFDFEYVDYDPVMLDRAIQALFFMAGVSYYKTFIPPGIAIKQGEMDNEMATFFSKTYQRGLGEFWYINKLDPHTPVMFPTNTEHVQQTDNRGGQGLLVAIGGGKDSLVSVELLRNQEGITTWSLNHRPQLTPLVERIALPHAWVGREWDTQLLDFRDKKELGAYGGHIPISAIFACAGTIVAILTGKRDVVMSNEQSASDPTLRYKGIDINHQYSKSLEFERDYQAFLNHAFGDRLRYYSFLRPLSEVRIAEIFAKIGFTKYKDVFSSCNRAFVHGSDHMSWCGVCPKCAFVFMVLTPFIPRKELESLWSGKNLLLDPALEPTYRNLLGIEGDKPLECVGDVKEARTAMSLAFGLYPELRDKYKFDLPDNYDYRALGSHKIPNDTYHTLADSLNQR